MDISAGLIAKTLGALAAASAVGGGTWWMLEGEDEVKSNKITKYDKALIDFLHEGGKVQFAVVSGDTALTEFPKNFSNTTPQTITVKIKVGESDGAADTEGKIVENTKSEAGNKSKRDYLRGMNGVGKSEWTWSCEMTFVKKNNTDAPTELDASQADMIFKSPNDGLFGKLKDESADKKIKKEFVRECGRARGREKNKEINEKPTNTEIKNSDEKKIKFTLVKGGDGRTNAGKLIFEKKEKFEEWFSFKENKANLAAG